MKTLTLMCILAVASLFASAPKAHAQCTDMSNSLSETAKVNGNQVSGSLTYNSAWIFASGIPARRTKYRPTPGPTPVLGLCKQSGKIAPASTAISPTPIPPRCCSAQREQHAGPHAQLVG
jgi:hypothetical protein